VSVVVANPHPPSQARSPTEEVEYVGVTVADQLFGLPIHRVYEVFVVSAITDVPLAPREILGLLNLRGRVVTALCLRRRLGLPDPNSSRGMVVGIERGGEFYGLLVDEVGEVLKLASDTREPNPVHMDPRWIHLSLGVHRLAGRLLVILNVDAVLALGSEARAA